MYASPSRSNRLCINVSSMFYLLIHSVLHTPSTYHTLIQICFESHSGTSLLISQAQAPMVQTNNGCEGDQSRASASKTEKRFTKSVLTFKQFTTSLQLSTVRPEIKMPTFVACTNEWCISMDDVNEGCVTRVQSHVGV